jgi:hypothetical protein
MEWRKVLRKVPKRYSLEQATCKGLHTLDAVDDAADVSKHFIWCAICRNLPQPAILFERPDDRHCLLLVHFEPLLHSLRVVIAAPFCSTQQARLQADSTSHHACVSFAISAYL